LVLTTKKHIVDQKRLKPGKIPLLHSLNSSPTVTICLITADPQRAFKDTIAHPLFPPELTPRITRVLGITKLKARYKSYESRRQLLAEHDVFLADSRVITMLPNLLGKVFYKGPKRPIPVNLEPFKPKDPTTGKRRSKPIRSASTKPLRAIASPQKAAQEIQRALASAQVQLSPSPTTSVRVGLASFTPDQVAENVEAVVHGMVEKFVTKGWRNVRSVHIKGPNTLALPIWLAQELWVAESDILEEAEAKRRVEGTRR
jgi:ribosome biogenesis protein UTP30